MRNTVQLPDDISRRIDSLVERSNLSRDQIVEDALSQGRSLAWQEQYVAGVLEGLAEAERGEFATEAEIEGMIDPLVETCCYLEAADPLRVGLRLDTEREPAERGNLDDLREAARLGFADLEEGRFTDVAVDKLAEHIAMIGEAAAKRAVLSRAIDEG